MRVSSGQTSDTQKLTDPIDFKLASGEMRVELVEISHDGEFIGHREEAHVGGLDDPGDAELLARLERLLAVADDVRGD